MSPEQLLRTYVRAKDDDRPHLLADVFASNARLEVNDRSGHLGFPTVTVGLEGIADVLVRRFNQTYDDIRSYYLDRPQSAVEAFTCDWLVGMTEKASRNVRVGCGQYEWKFAGHPDLRVTRLVITIEQMVVLAPTYATDVILSLRLLDYPWTSADRVTRALSLDELKSVKRHLARHAVIGQPSTPQGRRRTWHAYPSRVREHSSCTVRAGGRHCRSCFELGVARLSSNDGADGGNRSDGY